MNFSFAPNANPNPAAVLTVEALDHLLGQLQDLVSTIDTGLYCHLEADVFRSTPGGHVRHLLDHVRALLAATGDLDPASGISGDCVVCYDRRARGTAVESDPEACLALIGELRRKLPTIAAFHLPTPVQVEQIVNPGHPPVILESNALRELVFVYHHSIHHAALIAARLRQAGQSVPADFGVAPATLAANS